MMILIWIFISIIMFTSLIQAIKAVVRTNGRQAITGKNMQGVLLEMVQALGAFPSFAGMATPSTTPTPSDANVFYLAYEAGQYSGFGVTLNGQTYNIIRRTSQGWEVLNTNIKTSEAIGEDVAEIIASALEEYSTTTQMAAAIAEALQPYITKEEASQSIIDALVPYAKTNEVAAAITTALQSYATTLYVNEQLGAAREEVAQALIPYALKTDVAQAIATALQSYMTSEQTTQAIATAIATALTEYSTTAQVNAAIAQAVEGVNAEIINDELVAAAALNNLNDRVNKLPTKENISEEIDAKLQAMRNSIVAMIDTLRAEVIDNELVAAASLTDLNNNI